MRTATVLTLALGTTALIVPLPGAAFAQQAAFEGSCGDLNTLYEEAAGEVREEFADALDVATANDVEVCTAYIVRVQDAGGIIAVAADAATDVETETESFSASDTISQTVEITQKAVVDGQVIVRVPVPEVTVDQAGAEVAIIDAPATVSVDQAAPTIVVRQQPMSIALDMPQPTITIQQPAPEIIVTMPAPGVDVSRAQPEVSVVMGDPTVSVTQGDPQVDVQVQARLVDPNAPDAVIDEGNIVTRMEPLDGAGADAQANVRYTKAEPVVRVTDSDQEAQVSVNQAQPVVLFEPADPQVTVNFSGEPVIELQQVGEPTVTFEQDDAALATEPEAEAAAADMPEADADVAAVVVPVEEDAVVADPAVVAPRARMTPEDTNTMLARDAGRETDLMSIMAGDLEGRDVVSANNDDIGSISRVVSNSGRMYVVVEHGGFLGIGTNDIALPIERIALMGDDVLLLGLTEEDLEAMPEYDVTADADVAPDQAFEIGNVRP